MAHWSKSAAQLFKRKNRRRIILSHATVVIRGFLFCSKNIVLFALSESLVLRTYLDSVLHTSSHLEYMYTVQRWMRGDWWKHLSNELRYYLCLSRVWGKVYQLAKRESIPKPSLFCAPEISLIMTGNFILSWTITNFMSRVLHTTKISNAQMVEEMDKKERL